MKLMTTEKTISQLKNDIKKLRTLDKVKDAYEINHAFHDAISIAIDATDDFLDKVGKANGKDIEDPDPELMNQTPYDAVKDVCVDKDVAWNIRNHYDDPSFPWGEHVVDPELKKLDKATHHNFYFQWSQEERFANPPMVYYPDGLGLPFDNDYWHVGLLDPKDVSHAFDIALDRIIGIVRNPLSDFKDLAGVEE